MRDALGREDRAFPAPGHVTGEFSERAFGLQGLRGDFAFDHHLRVRRDLEVHGFTADEFQRFSPDAPGNRQLVDPEA